MAENGGTKPLHPRVEQFVNLVRRNIVISVLIVLATVFLAGTEILEKGIDVWDKLRPPALPKLSVALLDQRRPQSELKISPSWKNRYGAGFSEPVPVTIALANYGNGVASNVDVYLIYPPGIFNIQQSTGKPTLPAVIGDATALTGYETVQSFNVARIDPSPIVNIFEKELLLQFKFRNLFGIPVVVNGVPTLIPLSLDFTGGTAKRLGQFPIHYLVRSAESEKPVFGTVLLSLDNNNGVTNRATADFGTIKMKLVQRGHSPEQIGGNLIAFRDIDFFSDGLLGLRSTISSNCRQEKLNTLRARVSELQNEKDIWLDIKVSDAQVIKEVLLIDRGKNGTLDSLFVLVGEEWMEIAPEKEAPYLPLTSIISPSDDPCFTQALIQKMEIKGSVK